MSETLPRSPEPASQRDQSTLRTAAVPVFIAAIAALGAVMMTLTSSPTAKGASFLWLPAALQLVAGIWLGPWRGLIAGGLGAYLAGIIAYGGWGPVDIIMNLVAGGFANSMLPAFLFTLLRIDPSLGCPRIAAQKFTDAMLRILGILCLVVILPLALRPLDWGAWGYAPSLAIALLSPVVLRPLQMKTRHLILGIIVSVFISLVSAIIGGAGQVVGGQTWEGALIGTSLGWFLGDTIACVLGLYILATFTDDARKRGLAR